MPKRWIRHFTFFSCCASSLLFSTVYSDGASPPSSSTQHDPYKVRSWNWDYKETWREDKDAFYRGLPQTRAVQKDFRYQRPPGVGDPDDDFRSDARPNQGVNASNPQSPSAHDQNPWNDYPNPYFSKPY